MQEFQILGFPWVPPGVVSEVSARSCAKQNALNNGAKHSPPSFFPLVALRAQISGSSTICIFANLISKSLFMYIGPSGQDYLTF